MVSYPLSFFAKAQSSQGILQLWTSESQSIESQCSIPPEFEGPGGGLSPEDLFAQALTNCFIATFKVFAEKSKLSYRSIHIDTELVVGPNDNNKPVMRNCHFEILISGCENHVKARLLAQRVFQAGFILNSVKTELSMNLKLSH